MEDKNRPGGWERSLGLILSRFTIGNLIMGLSWVELPSGCSEGRGGLCRVSGATSRTTGQSTMQLQTRKIKIIKKGKILVVGSAHTITMHR
jgi:hypothetical protein